MKTIEETLARAADDVRDKVAQVPARSVGAAAGRGSAARLMRVGALAMLMLSLGTIIFFGLDRGSATRGFVTPPIEPEREADLFIWFPFDMDPVDAELAVAEVGTWQGVEFSLFWGPDRTRQEFSEMFADQPSLIAIVEDDPSVLPTSVRVWLTPDADRDALVELARQSFADAVEVGTPLEAGVVPPGPTTANGEATVTTIAVPTELEPAGVELQHEILADDKVTRDEFVRAVSLMAACMIDRGLTGVTWSVDADGGGWSSEYASPTGNAAEAETIEIICFYSYIDRVPLGTWEPTELPAPVAAVLPVLEELDAQLLDLLNRAHQIESDWENRRETLANTADALNGLQADLRTWVESVAERTDIPTDLEAAYAVLVDEASDLPNAAEEILIGLQVPEDGTQRKAAVDAFVDEALDVIYAIDTLRRGGQMG
jgi:hypothetical protein